MTLDSTPVQVQLEDMRAALVRLQRQHEELEGQLALQGLVGGSTATLSTGQIGFGSAADGRPIGLMNNTGIQIRTSAADVEGLYFLGDDFSETPSTTVPRASVQGSASTSTESASIDMRARGGNGGVASVGARSDDASAGAEDATVTLTVIPQGLGSHQVELELTSVVGGAKRLALSNGSADSAVFGLASNTADPTFALVDGDIWYRSDTDKIRARINGVTVDLATGSGGSVGVITNARDWLDSVGHTYWANFGSADLVAASGATNVTGLDSYGWLTTSLVGGVSADGTTIFNGDLNSSGDEEPMGILGNAAGDLLVSPQIFGGYSAFQIAEALLGSAPTKLCCEFRASFTVASANETDTYIGFVPGATTDPTAAGGVAAIVSDGTNFKLRSDNGDDTGALIDTSLHTWRIEVGPTTTEWFIDGATQGTITTEADVYPTSFKKDTGTTNRIFLAWVRCYYE